MPTKPKRAGRFSDRNHNRLTLINLPFRDTTEKQSKLCTIQTKQSITKNNRGACAMLTVCHL